jgi:integrase
MGTILGTLHPGGLVTGRQNSGVKAPKRRRLRFLCLRLLPHQPAHENATCAVLARPSAPATTRKEKMKIPNMTDTQIKSLRPPENDKKISFGDGLCLLVKKNGTKLWRFRYQFNGKENMISLGPYVSVREARIKVGDAHTLIAKGIDPSQAKKDEKHKKIENTQNTFEAVALKWYESWKKDKNKNTQQATKSRLEHHVFPTLGKMPVSEINSSDVLTTLKEMEEKQWRGKTLKQTIKKTGVNISQIMRYAIIMGVAKYDPYPPVRAQLNRIKEGHHAAIITPREFGLLLQKIDSYNKKPVALAAVKLVPLLFVRKIELRRARWKDIDFKKSKWTYFITKTGTEHYVPLSRQAVAILKDLAQITKPEGESNDALVFPGERGEGKPFCESAMNKILNESGYKGKMTVHGFRASARTLLAEELEYNPEWIEHQLGHVVNDSNGTAYNRTKFLRLRTEMMQAWADYLDRLKAGPEPSTVSANGTSEQLEPEDPFWYLPYNDATPVA